MIEEESDSNSFIGPRAIIDLGEIKNNYELIKKLLPSEVITSAVVKSNSYGIGAKEVSRVLYDAGCRTFWTAYISEALYVREVLPYDAEIFYLQGFRQSDFKLIKERKVYPVINSIEDFNLVIKNEIRFVLHIDSGLSRLGIRPREIDLLLPHLKNEDIAFVISHLACSDERNNPLNEMQQRSFNESLNKIKRVINVKAGISATGGALLGRAFCCDMVRIGAFLYGIQNTEDLKPKNILTITAKVLQKYHIEKGTNVGYSATFQADKDMKIAVVSIGYADGMKRSLSNRGFMGFYDKNGKFYKAPIIGRISMDLTTCDVSNIPDEATEVFSNAFVICPDYTINDMASDSGTIPYEILTSINLTSKRFAVSYI